MTLSQFDVAIVGSTPSAHLLAALLGADHSRRVILIHNRARRGALARSLDFAIGLTSRPASWHMATSGGQETGEWLAAAGGRGTLVRHDLAVVAAPGPHSDFLGHVRAMADHSGYQTARAGGRTGAGELLIFSDVGALSPGWETVFTQQWLGQRSVREVGYPSFAEAPGTGIPGPETSGSAIVFKHGDEMISAEMVVLMDYEGARAFGGDHLALKTLSATRYTTVHTTQNATRHPGPDPARFPGGAGLLLGLHVQAIHTGANASFIVRGEGGAAARHIMAAAPGFGKTEIVGQVVFERFETGDGAPVVSFDTRLGSWIIAGLGPQGFFLMPSLARHLSGSATGSEAAYWRAHGVLRGAMRRDLAELGAGVTL